ncbi:hypothetical protein KYB31_03960 [Clostridium felsineum]|uniref:hypothetical protein n=1 Tax=Clostridium felsineum TaxID=36839 RepID=UPI00214DCAD1|nr:hypothetical protein [Clostridium felsineum]MCR3758152.1 hypothetical protein [Clostridium felsineum]
MNIGSVQDYKLQIGEKEYTFRLNFKSLMKFQDKYKNSMKIFNDFLKSEKQYINEIKILSCCCIEKEWTEEELAEKISWDFPTMKVLDAIAIQMIQGSLIVDDEGKENNNEKNMETSQEKKE